MNSPDRENITAVVLAGGRGRRLGGQDKGLMELDGKLLIAHILDLVTPQVNAVIINANRNQQVYAEYGYPVISDNMTDYQGPLAGFAAALAACNTDYIMTLPCDGPYVPADLVSRLCTAIEDNNADLAVAHDGHRMQPVYALIPRSLLESLQDFLDAGDRKIDLWYARHNTALADFSDVIETFFNINTEEDLRKIDEPGTTT
ncbi:MAG: molybdenum cofactor guanylyltransferase MobA [Gammaproteobacteria bacterium]|nr:molybdenum cofactor guanylyltransferase MobA [Gammaproteobacteria bacterium]MDX2487036.1 molybdenum cofactor guanylyltransferase MobA [Gammaproteobacteria bacterium]